MTTLNSKSSEQNIKDLIEFYSGGVLPRRIIDLAQRRVISKASKKDHETLAPYLFYREAIREINAIHNRKLDHPGLLQKFSHPLLRRLLQLEPESFFILLASHRFRLSDAELSIILSHSEDHLRFRRNQIEKQLDGKDASEIVTLCRSSLDFLKVDITPAKRLRKNAIDRFRSLPLPARFLIETGVVLGVLVFLMWLIPEMRNRYETAIQKRINDYLIESTITDAPAPEGTSKTPQIVTPPVEEVNHTDTDEPETKPAESQTKKPLKVNEGETWRFSFTGPITNDILNGVTTTLAKMGHEDVKPVTVPGGIQLDFYLPIRDLASLKLNLEEMTAKLQRHSNSATPEAPAPISLSWYKKKNMNGRKITSGHVEVVVWISTL